MVAEKIKTDSLNKTTNKIIPFLKWAGGKRWLVRKYPQYFSKCFNGKYIEPFLGGGSVFTAIMPSNAQLSDINYELINLYKQVKTNPEKIIKKLQNMQKNHSKEYYYMIRNIEFQDSFEKAARFIYLNRTCFNGIYRVNKKGKFNVPKGSKSSVILPTDDFFAWSKALENVDLVVSDFEQSISKSKYGDYIFADPPYTVSHNENGFLKYNEILFSWDDQIRLAESLKKASERGVIVVATNANHPEVYNLYKDNFNIDIVSRASTIAASSDKRNIYEEIVIHNL